MKKNIKFTSVIITSLNDGKFLDNILSDLLVQDLDNAKYEILVLEAGVYKNFKTISKAYSESNIKISFYFKEKLSRTASLNYLIDKTVGDFVVRLDTRSRVKKDYLSKLILLSDSTQAACVGGTKLPVGTSKIEKIIAATMINPFTFGGGKFRKLQYKGEANGVYLGAFRKDQIPYKKWYDEIHPRGSEDTDLSRRIINNGGKIYIDSDIVVEYQPRDTYLKFFLMCYNYGVARGIFFIKHFIFNDIRQLVPLLCLLCSIILIYLSKYDLIYILILGYLILLYIILVVLSSLRFDKKLSNIFYLSFCVIGCHFFWTIGFLISPFIFKKNQTFRSIFK